MRKYSFTSIILTVIALALVSCNHKVYQIKQVESSKKGMVVSAHPLASQAGAEVLKKGGNATDAAIAVQFALAVVCPRAGNLGGGGFWVHAPINDGVRTLDYREEAPSFASEDMYLDDDNNVIPKLSLEGPLAAGIPGQVDGMWAAYTFGSKLKNWKLLLQPAIRYAKQGFYISQTEADRLNYYAEAFKAQNQFDFPFVKKEGQWKAGDKIVQVQLANTLTKIANQGANYFYEGAFANDLVNEIRGRGGIWQTSDLVDYQSVWRQPIEKKFKDYTVYSMPPPSSGGVVLSQMLTLIEDQNLNQLAQQDSVLYFHTIIEAMRRAYEDRATYLGDPDVVDIPLEKLLSKDYLKQKWETFDVDKATPSGSMIQGEKKEVYETTHTSVVDKEGNAVSITTTLNGNFGCKVWSKVGGFFLNNEMDDFSVKPGVPNQFGLVGGKANAIAPSKRMLSSMTPTIVQKNGKNVLVLGSPGGSTIITSVMQTLLHVLDQSYSLEKAVKMPRFHHQWLPDEVIHESGLFSAGIKQGLQEKGHQLRQVKAIGKVKAIHKNENGLQGVGDFRNPDDAAKGL